jgi:virulence-associated protein VagC
LFYWHNDDDDDANRSAHYAAVININALFLPFGSRKNYHLCPKCLGKFKSQDNVSAHLNLCRRPNGNIYNYKFPPPEKNFLRFRDYHKMLEAPFVGFADCECITRQIRVVKGNTVLYQKHREVAIACKIVTRGVQVQVPYAQFSGPDCIPQFLDWLVRFEERTLSFLRDEQRMIITPRQQEQFEVATTCHICRETFPSEGENGEPLRRGMQKVRDHDHLTGLYRGAAHSKCNILFFHRLKIPIFFHNGRNYDFHLLVKHLSLYPDRRIKLIGQSLEKYMLIGWGRHIVFKDSLLFLVGQSLERAVNLLRTATDQPEEQRFAQLFTGFGTEFAANPEQKDLLIRKGIFPYDWFNRWSRLKYNRLPKMSAFHSKLRNTKISIDDFRHAHKVLADSCRYLERLLYLL